MVGEFMFNLVFGILKGLLSLLPDITWVVDNNAISTFLDIVSVVLYLLPINTVFAILTIVVALNIFKIIVSIVKTIWDLLPLV